ncbi:MAG: flavodoxin family protein, partial [Prolixibacteraceae bacterium]|nr:flavodoxin family protein [Prolixibacteraceae bacterium]
KFCQGCWNCWWKNPGECSLKDDMPNIYRSYMDSDLVLHYSPMIAGFISSRLKTINDRSVPLVHPYVTLVNNECHHKKRYMKYPLMGLIVERCDSDDEELEIARDMYSRLALNLKSKLSFFATTEKSQEEIIDEISNL